MRRRRVVARSAAAAVAAMIVTGSTGAWGQSSIETARFIGGPLAALESLNAEATIADIEAHLQQAYDNQITSLERARAFGLAAELASRRDAHPQALAWIDWGLEESEQLRGEPDEEKRRLLSDAIRIALAADDPLRAREYARRYGELEIDWLDDPVGLGVDLDPLRGSCPDAIDDRFIRVAIERGQGAAGDAAARTARCRYAAFAQSAVPDGLELELYAQRAWAPVRGRIRGIVESGLDPNDAARRGAIAETLPVLTTLVERDPSAAPEGEAGYALYSRPGVNEVAAIAYLIEQSDGTLLAARVSANDRAWPPTGLLEIANAAFAAMKGAQP